MWHIQTVLGVTQISKHTLSCVLEFQKHILNLHCLLHYLGKVIILANNYIVLTLCQTGFFKHVTHLILTTALCGMYNYYPHFTDEEAETLKQGKIASVWQGGNQSQAIWLQELYSQSLF